MGLIICIVPGKGISEITDRRWNLRGGFPSPHFRSGRPQEYQVRQAGVIGGRWGWEELLRGVAEGLRGVGLSGGVGLTCGMWLACGVGLACGIWLACEVGLARRVYMPCGVWLLQKRRKQGFRR